MYTSYLYNILVYSKMKDTLSHQRPDQTAEPKVLTFWWYISIPLMVKRLDKKKNYPNPALWKGEHWQKCFYVTSMYSELSFDFQRLPVKLLKY